MNYIVLDTNVFVQNFWMDSSSFLILLKNHKVVAEQLVVPAVVRDEVISQFEKKYKEQYAKIEHPIKKIESQLKVELNLEKLIGFSEKLNTYREFFDNLILEFDIEVIGYPDVRHRVIAEKAMRRKKPFKDNGEGYCDALIWENIILLMSRSECDSVAFITNNSKDFIEKENLHTELILDLKERGLDPKKISCHTLLKSFTDVKILPHLELSESLLNKINNCDFEEFDFESWLEDGLFDLIDARNAARALIGLETENCDMHLTEVYEVKNIIAHDVRLIGDATRYVELSVNAGVSCEVCADWQQYQRDYEVKRLLDEGTEYPAPYACTSFSGPVSLKLALVVEGDEIENSNLELISIGDNGITKKFR
ncbi:PIN domain-containing protein [Billgrantia sp. C5P2]|uniref:PIN domain-containing protein n=1 Tax=Billgrantia sp. C5P2 TaxID=3436239 RepID=UPI003DA2F351